MAVDDVTVLIPHIPTRGADLVRAVSSVNAQTHVPRGIVITTDTRRDGSALTRNRALYHISTSWVAFLDDDDEFLPNHLEVLTRAAIETNVSVVYSGCLPIGLDGRELPRHEEWGRFGRPFDADLLRRESYIPVTSLVRVELAVRALFGPPSGHMESDYDDWGFYLRLLDHGAKFLHVPEVTWVWHHHGQNTSGRSDRW